MAGIGDAGVANRYSRMDFLTTAATRIGASLWVSVLGHRADVTCIARSLGGGLNTLCVDSECGFWKLLKA